MEAEGNNKNSIAEFSVDLLREYYARFFPYKAMFDWLSYGSTSDYIYNREWSFTIEDDIYLRYQSFRTLDEMIELIRKRQPHKIDIGAVFSNCPKDHTTLRPEQFYPVERELVFDVDMTDYDEIRTCCKGADICMKCWPFMTMALKIVDQILRDDFGFMNILWVYSGRRGIHCWVCDTAAKVLENDARAAIIDYMTVTAQLYETNTDKQTKNPFQTTPYHPLIRRAYQVLEPYFEKYIASDKGQGIFTTREGVINFLNRIPDQADGVRKELFDEWESKKQASSTIDLGVHLWHQIKAYGGVSNPKKRKNDNILEQWRYQVVFHYCYPRLDANVSKARNHLLKSPFCIHPKTGRVCVPIDPKIADDFNPFSVPTARTLCEEVDTYGKLHGNDANVSDVNKTSMKAIMETFDRTFMKNLVQSIRREQREAKEKESVGVIDF